MRRATAFVLLLLCVSLCVCAGCGRRSAPALERVVVEIASEGQLWPGFDPLATPLAIFDGTDTHLFRHPAPPEGFVEERGAYVFEGRHPAVVANSAAWIGDIATATVWLETLPEESTPRDRAALVFHESFHVFQRTTGRQWGADETHLFTYPVESYDLLTLRRLETEALRRAFEPTDDEAADDDAAADWARVALDARRRRFKRMDDAYAAYERGIEVLEGTATYVEYKAAGRAAPDLPPEGFDPEDVRSRAYSTGVAWALLLDRFAPDWLNGFDADDTLLLDTALAQALQVGRTRPGCDFTAAERGEIEHLAREDVLSLLKGRVERREAFDSAPGWKLVIETTEGDPLWPQGFDPLNVRHVAGGILHTRFLKLGNESGALEVMGDTVLTEEVGPHPLFDGVLRMTLGGLAEEPAVEIDGDRVSVSMPTLSAEFSGASVGRSEDRVVIRLRAG